MSTWGSITTDYPAAQRASRKQVIDGFSNVALVSARKLSQRFTFEENYVKENFQIIPTVAATGGGTPSGTTGAVNLCDFPRTNFEYVVLGAGQTILAPVLGTDGLDISGDQTATEGFEFTVGNTSRSRAAAVIGTNIMRFIMRFKIADASGCSTFFLGFRKVQAYAPALATYTDFAGFNLAAGTLNVATQTATGGVVSTTSGVTVADGDWVQVQVDVGKSGQCQFRAYASAVKPTFTDMSKVTNALNVAYTFTTGLTTIPDIFMLQGADLSGTLNLDYMEAGNLV